MPAKNRAFDNTNLDLGGDFGEDNIMAGDQSAPPGGFDDDFGADDLLEGDQNMNLGDGSVIMQEEESDDDADEEDKAFLKEVTKPKATKN